MNQVSAKAWLDSQLLHHVSENLVCYASNCNLIFGELFHFYYLILTKNIYILIPPFLTVLLLNT